MGVRHMLTGLSAFLMIWAGLAVAEEAPKGATRVVAGTKTRVFVLAGFDATCKAKASPEITIDQPPRQGRVSMAERQETIVQMSLSGRCIGARIEGLGIFYEPSAEAVGHDSFTLTARMPTGETATRTFHVRIANF